MWSEILSLCMKLILKKLIFFRQTWIVKSHAWLHIYIVETGRKLLELKFLTGEPCSSRRNLQGDFMRRVHIGELRDGGKSKQLNIFYCEKPEFKLHRTSSFLPPLFWFIKMGLYTCLLWNSFKEFDYDKDMEKENW